MFGVFLRSSRLFSTTPLTPHKNPVSTRRETRLLRLDVHVLLKISLDTSSRFFRPEIVVDVTSCYSWTGSPNGEA